MVEAVQRFLRRTVVTKAGHEQVVGKETQTLGEIGHAAHLQIRGGLVEDPGSDC